MKRRKQLVEVVQANFEEQMRRIDECPFFPEYPSIWTRAKSKLELRHELLIRTQQLLSRVL